jgi:hypothetical protein
MAKLRGPTRVREGSNTGVRGSWSNGVAGYWIGRAKQIRRRRDLRAWVISGETIRSRSIGGRVFAGSAYILVWPNRKT